MVCSGENQNGKKEVDGGDGEGQDGNFLSGIVVRFLLEKRRKAVVAMKKGIHPEYRLVVFKDVATGKTFLTRSAVQTKETIRWVDGKEYPLYKMEVSRYSHPFFTGQMRYVDTAGRVEKFMRRYKRFYEGQEANAQKAEKEVEAQK